MFRFEYVASVVDPTLTVSLSYAVDVVVSAESMCSQNVSVAEAQLAGTWLYSPDFKDEWVSRRLKWQAWTIYS